MKCSLTPRLKIKSDIIPVQLVSLSEQAHRTATLQREEKIKTNPKLTRSVAPVKERVTCPSSIKVGSSNQAR